MNAPLPATQAAAQDTGVSVARRYLDALYAHGVRHLFGNAGTDFPPLIEALSQARAQGEAGIEPVVVPHEGVAISMAYGAWLASRQPQVVMAHVGLGTANLLCGLFNVARQHVPLLIAAGRTPVLESGALGARNNYINWAQEMFDQAGMLRELVKWEYELRLPEQVEAVVDRAFAIAQSSPPGPAYLVLPREVLAASGPAPAPQAPCAPIACGRAPARDLAQLAQWIAQAKRPLIITADGGRDEAGFAALDRFSRRHQIPVVQYRPRFLCIPCDSPLHAGYDPNPWLPAADLVIVVEADVPWLPDSVQPSASASVVHIGKDPLYARYPMRSHRCDLSMQCDYSAAFEELDTLLPASSGRDAAWLARCGKRAAAPDAQSLNHRYVSHCVNAALGDDGVLFNEYTFTLEDLDLNDPGRYFCHSPAGGLGWAMGAAMGYRLNRPDALCVATIGDGTYMFGEPSPTHFVSRARGLPFITVIYNNRRWAAVHRATLSMYPAGQAAADAEPVLSTLEPAPDYEKIVEASGGLGLRVTSARDLPAALERARHAVQVENRQAVINVLTEISYGRTS